MISKLTAWMWPDESGEKDEPLPLSSWLSFIPKTLHPSLRTLLVHALRLGPRPKHVAFIMDGNRRYARTRASSEGGPVDVRVGHEEGFEALKRVLSFFLKLEIPHVTVYAFSIENFNRDPKEVEALMDMARVRLVEICEKGALLDRHGVQIRILGRRDLLPLDVQESCARAEALTAGNTRGILNFCCPYTSQEEMATAIKRTVDACASGQLLPEFVSDIASLVLHRTDSASCCSDITEETISQNLYTSASPPLDILIRTSGVARLSDFLLWQANEDAVIHFIPPNWPDIGVVDILPPLLSYQGEQWAAWLMSHFGWSS